MRWSIEELIKAWKMHSEFRFIHKIIRFPKNLWRYLKTLIHWVFTGYCNESLWNLNTTFMETIIQKLTQFQKTKKCGHPMYMSDVEWDDMLTRLIKGFKIMKDESFLDDLPLAEMLKVEIPVPHLLGQGTAGAITFKRYGQSDIITNDLYKKQIQNDKETLALFIKYFGDLWD